MNLLKYTESQAQQWGQLNPLMASSGAAGQILSDAAKQLMAIQTDWVSVALAQALNRLVPSFAPGHPSDSLWQLPADYKVESQRWMQGLSASMEVLSRAQQQMCELQAQPATAGVQDAR